MAKTKTIFAIALFMGFSSFAFAGTGSPKDAPKANDKASANETVEAESPNTNLDLYYYEVTDLVGTSYSLQQIPASTGTCPTGQDACEVSSTNDYGTTTTALKATVDANQGGFSVLGQQDIPRH